MCSTQNRSVYLHYNPGTVAHLQASQQAELTGNASICLSIRVAPGVHARGGLPVPRRLPTNVRRVSDKKIVEIAFVFLSGDSESFDSFFSRPAKEIIGKFPYLERLLFFNISKAVTLPAGLLDGVPQLKEFSVISHNFLCIPDNFFGATPLISTVHLKNVSGGKGTGVLALGAQPWLRNLTNLKLISDKLIHLGSSWTQTTPSLERLCINVDTAAAAVELPPTKQYRLIYSVLVGPKIFDSVRPHFNLRTLRNITFASTYVPRLFMLMLATLKTKPSSVEAPLVLPTELWDLILLEFILPFAEIHARLALQKV